MKENILGRESEKELLSRIYESKRSEFVALCGRRRVGKTFLVREFFEEEMFFSMCWRGKCRYSGAVEKFLPHAS